MIEARGWRLKSIENFLLNTHFVFNVAFAGIEKMKIEFIQ